MFFVLLLLCFSDTMSLQTVSLNSTHGESPLTTTSEISTRKVRGKAATYEFKCAVESLEQAKSQAKAAGLK